MSEIKGQLLGIILLLTIFATVSVGIATVFATTRDAMVEKSENVADAAEQVLTVNDDNSL